MQNLSGGALRLCVFCGLADCNPRQPPNSFSPVQYREICPRICRGRRFPSARDGDIFMPTHRHQAQHVLYTRSAMDFAGSRDRNCAHIQLGCDNRNNAENISSCAMSVSKMTGFGVWIWMRLGSGVIGLPHAEITKLNTLITINSLLFIFVSPNGMDFCVQRCQPVVLSGVHAKMLYRLDTPETSATM